MKQRIRGVKFQEHFNQAQLFYNSLMPHEKAHLVSALSFELSHCDDPDVYKSYTELLNNIDFDLATKVAINVNGVVPEKPARTNHGKSSASLSQEYFRPKNPTIVTRRIAILVADGYNAVEVQTVRKALTNAKAVTWVIGPRRGRIDSGDHVSKNDEPIIADSHFDGQRSTLFDAVFIPSGANHAKALLKSGRALHWIKEAFGHCKTIGAIGDGKELTCLLHYPTETPFVGVTVVKHAIGLSDVEFADVGDNVVTSYGVVTTGNYSTVSAITDLANIALDKGFVSKFIHEISKHRCWERELDGLTQMVAY